MSRQCQCYNWTLINLRYIHHVGEYWIEMSGLGRIKRISDFKQLPPHVSFHDWRSYRWRAWWRGHSPLWSPTKAWTPAQPSASGRPAAECLRCETLEQVWSRERATWWEDGLRVTTVHIVTSLFGGQYQAASQPLPLYPSSYTLQSIKSKASL